ncbi:MAG TPA: hypothetical protein VMX56_07810, partial [Anaerolineales bacterium]|nr:hypothetical protein [Anaerolineales bacterium]
KKFRQDDRLQAEREFAAELLNERQGEVAAELRLEEQLARERRASWEMFFSSWAQGWQELVEKVKAFGAAEAKLAADRKQWTADQEVAHAASAAQRAAIFQKRLTQNVQEFTAMKEAQKSNIEHSQKYLDLARQILEKEKEIAQNTTALSAARQQLFNEGIAANDEIQKGLIAELEFQTQIADTHEALVTALNLLAEEYQGIADAADDTAAGADQWRQNILKVLAIYKNIDELDRQRNAQGITLGNIFLNAASDIESAFANLFRGMTRGVKDLGQLWSGILDSIYNEVSRIMAKMVVKDVFSAIGSIFGFAEGGIVTKPTLAMVGESGPELIAPLSKLSSLPPSISGQGIGGGSLESPTVVHAFEGASLSVDSLSDWQLHTLGQRLRRIWGDLSLTDSAWEPN